MLPFLECSGDLLLYLHECLSRTKPRNWFHRLNADLATRSAALRSLLIWFDDLFYGKRPKGRPLPYWLSPTR